MLQDNEENQGKLSAKASCAKILPRGVPPLRNRVVGRCGETKSERRFENTPDQLFTVSAAITKHLQNSGHSKGRMMQNEHVRTDEVNQPKRKNATRKRNGFLKFKQKTSRVKQILDRYEFFHTNRAQSGMIVYFDGRSADEEAFSFSEFLVS